MAKRYSELVEELELQTIKESIFKKIVASIRGYSQDDYRKKVENLSKSELESIVNHMSPKSARRVLSKKDYFLWNAAYEKLNSLS